MIEKDLPSVLNIMEKIEPLGPQQPVETPSTQVTENKLRTQSTNFVQIVFPYVL